MGKSEILMLLAGVALSIMLAMVAIPMFSSGNEMADRQQVQQELMAINSAIPLIKALEGSEYSGTPSVGKITAENIARHMEGFKEDPVGTLKGAKGDLATYKIDDTKATNINGNTITVTATPVAGSRVELEKLSRLGSICVNVSATGVVKDGVKGTDYKFNAGALECTMKR